MALNASPRVAFTALFDGEPQLVNTHLEWVFFAVKTARRREISAGCAKKFWRKTKKRRFCFVTVLSRPEVPATGWPKAAAVIWRRALWKSWPNGVSWGTAASERAVTWPEADQGSLFRTDLGGSFLRESRPRFRSAYGELFFRSGNASCDSTPASGARGNDPRRGGCAH